MLVFDHSDGGIADLERFARMLIIPGFEPLDAVLGRVREWVGDAGRITHAQAEAAARQIWRARVAEQRLWTETGDYDRLRLAYADLERQGILARMNFACCKNCADHEIEFERAEHPNPPDWYRFREWAYVYFHQQDGHRLADDDCELLFGYRAFRALPGTAQTLLDAAASGDSAAQAAITERTDNEVGRLITEAFRRHGLNTDWSGHHSDRIGVRIDQWRKPLPLAAPY